MFICCGDVVGWWWWWLWAVAVVVVACGSHNMLSVLYKLLRLRSGGAWSAHAHVQTPQNKTRDIQHKKIGPWVLPAVMAMKDERCASRRAKQEAMGEARDRNV